MESEDHSSKLSIQRSWCAAILCFIQNECEFTTAFCFYLIICISFLILLIVSPLEQKLLFIVASCIFTITGPVLFGPRIYKGVNFFRTYSFKKTS